jgi:diguanylate cyclase (GGDEF)-like protein/PAS domain S-box-containing protein
MPHNILLIEHDPVDAQRVKDSLAIPTHGLYRLEWVQRCSRGLNRLARETGHDPDGIAAVLIDLFLPDSQGLETFHRVFRVAPHIPILVLSARQHEDIARMAVQHGAQEYLLKSRIDSYLLPKTLGSMIERGAIAEALFDEKERAQVTLNSIGDGVLSSDLLGRVTYLNVVAEHLTGWSRVEAAGRSLEEVFHVVDGATRLPVPNPLMLAMHDNRTQGLTPNCVLIRRDGVESVIEDSVAPIHDRQGQVTGGVMVFRDVSKTRALSAKMLYLAHHDSLTGLSNRTVLNDRLSQAIALAQRHKHQLAVLFLDLDRFKYVNDSLGHGFGDRLLQLVAERLLTCVRTSDTVTRLGGDEFVILLSELRHPEDAAVSAEKILLALRAPYCLGEHTLYLTVSLGIVIYPDDGVDSESLMKRVDFAMYHAKDRGRNNYQFFKPAMHARALERQIVEGDLHRAVQQHEFFLHYQPKVVVETGAIVGVEALIRWVQPHRGLASPAEFVAVAEECGVIVPIGQWVLREACLQARLWKDEGLLPGRIAVNVSAAELRNKDFVAGVREILLEAGLAPSDLELELTETFLMQDLQMTAAVLQALKELGVTLALDDFGTGFSSLSHLKRFPIDTLKIDQSFVRHLTTDTADVGIVSAVINMGKSLRMQVVAEGVETWDQLRVLKQHHCPEAQGFYFSEPLTAAGIAILLKAGVINAPLSTEPAQKKLRIQ